MCQLHINRGVILELGQTEDGSWSTERAKLGQWWEEVLCRGLIRSRENSIAPKVVGDVPRVSALLCAEDPKRQSRLECCLQAIGSC